MSTLLGSLIGQQAAQGLTSPAGQQAINAAFSTAYQQYYGSSIGSIVQQSQALNAQSQAAQYNQALINGQAWRQPTEWMIAGRAMSFAEFVDTLCPDPDDAMRSLLILKYSGRTPQS